MNAYDRYKKAQARRVARGITTLVPVWSLERGMVSYGHNMTISHVETFHNGNPLVKFTDGTGYVESPDTNVEVYAR